LIKHASRYFKWKTKHREEDEKPACARHGLATALDASPQGSQFALSDGLLLDHHDALVRQTTSAPTMSDAHVPDDTNDASIDNAIWEDLQVRVVWRVPRLLWHSLPSPLHPSQLPHARTHSRTHTIIRRAATRAAARHCASLQQFINAHSVGAGVSMQVS
jgi:hypothetical protein